MPLAPPTRAADRRVVPPTTTAITSPWGPRESAADGAIRQHNGVDLAGVEGTTPVVAVAAGVVEHATGNGARGFSCYGRVVVVHHPDLDVWTLYAHLHDVAVEVGQEVQPGTLIGHVGATNGSPAHPDTTFRDGRCLPGGELAAPNPGSGPHLHFEVSPRRYPQSAAAARIDPIAWLGAHGVTYSSATRGGRPSPLASAPTGPVAPRGATSAAPRSGGGGWGWGLLFAAGLGFVALMRRS